MTSAVYSTSYLAMAAFVAATKTAQDLPGSACGPFSIVQAALIISFLSVRFMSQRSRT